MVRAAVLEEGRKRVWGLADVLNIFLSFDWQRRRFALDWAAVEDKVGMVVDVLLWPSKGMLYGRGEGGQIACASRERKSVESLSETGWAAATAAAAAAAAAAAVTEWSAGLQGTDEKSRDGASRMLLLLGARDGTPMGDWAGVGGGEQKGETWGGLFMASFVGSSSSHALMKFPAIWHSECERARTPATTFW